MKEWLKKYKNDIFVGIVVFLITSFFSKIIHVFLEYAPSAGNSIIEKLRDFVYYQAGHQSSYSLNALLFHFVLYVWIFYLLNSISKGFFSVNKLDKAEKADKKISEISKANAIEQGLEVVDEKEEKTQKNRKKKNENSISKKIRICLIVLSVITVIFVTFIYTYEIIPYTIWNSFELSTTKIAPYIIEDEEEVLRSKWVSMVSKNDYDEIKNYIEEIKEMNELN